MESIEKLRAIAKFMAKGRDLENHEDCNLLLIISDKIEREISERYMLLPVDADGVPIHVGDVMEYENPNDDDKPFTVLGVNNEGDVFHCLEDKRLVPTCISVAYYLRHHNPRTVEDVLRDYWREACELPVDMSDESTAEAIDKLVVKYRAEICELRLMGVDE